MCKATGVSLTAMIESALAAVIEAYERDKYLVLPLNLMPLSRLETKEDEGRRSSPGTARNAKGKTKNTVV